MKALLALATAGMLVVATIGLSGEGPAWTKYVGSGMVFLLLMLILTGVSNLPSAVDLKKSLMGIDPSPPKGPMPAAPDDDDDLPSRRSARN